MFRIMRLEADEWDLVVDKEDKPMEFDDKEKAKFAIDIISRMEGKSILNYRLKRSA